MSNISSIGSQASATAATTSLSKTYSALDTNEDGVVSAAELAAATAPTDKDETAAADRPTTSSADTLSDQVASAILDVKATDAGDQSANSVQNALSAYLAAEKS